MPQNHQIQGTVLRISETRQDDRGLYVCVAENVAGRAQAAAILDVELREAPEVELYPGGAVSAEPGASVLFQCRITAGNPPPEITWSRANSEVFSPNTEVTEANGVIRFTRVTGDEQGAYICTATNAQGSVTATATLTVSGGAPRVTISPASPHTVRGGQRVQLECVAEGNPAPAVSWSRADNLGGVVRNAQGLGSAVLVLERVTSRDAGTYVCTAIDANGASADGRLELNVEEHTGGVEHLSVSVIPESLTIAAGNQATFRCQALGYPTPSVQWEKRGGTLPPSHIVRGGELVIPRVTAQDGGEYICSARNAAEVADAVVLLTVQSE